MLLAGFVVLLASACAGTPPRASPSPAMARLAEDPAMAGRVDAYFAPLAAHADLSGTLVVMRGDRPVLVRHYGYADWPARKAHTLATRYSAASVTKGVVAATLVQLERAGTVSLDQPVGRWLPALADRPGMSLRAVLHHSAGLPRDLPDDFPIGEADVAAWLAAHPDRLQTPGKERYSNVGYALLAEVVARASGRPFAEVARERVLRPAGMDDSQVALQTADQVPGGALPYTAGPEPEGVMTPVPAPLEIGSSGLVTTAPDLARWARTLADGAYPELFVDEDPLGSIDTGHDDNGDYVSVQGTLPGYSANAIAWRDTDLSVAFAGNLFDYPVLRMGKTLRGLLGPAPPAPSPARPAAVPLTASHRALAGRYVHPDFGTIAIAEVRDRGGMTLTMPGQPAYWSFHLTPIAEGGLHWRAFGVVFRPGEAGGLLASPADGGEATTVPVATAEP
ncbi:serine hydrolase domain-containing protein [Marilutibacter spongiae]|uniref:Beta-lactamase family protein n=1 Tax=Marilutibacter spongiae TaxID=2025720 RepID=A0A7W3TJY5_9GAMM|nr:serine hydrolase domain-containing protein [Lysobacter spongiae]MBB1059742.1 beta-lactamase family protein [Lysobacter spongiae]